MYLVTYVLTYILTYLLTYKKIRADNHKNVGYRKDNRNLFIYFNRSLPIEIVKQISIVLSVAYVFMIVSSYFFIRE